MHLVEVHGGTGEFWISESNTFFSVTQLSRGKFCQRQWSCGVQCDNLCMLSGCCQSHKIQVLTDIVRDFKLEYRLFNLLKHLLKHFVHIGAAGHLCILTLGWDWHISFLYPQQRLKICIHNFQIIIFWFDIENKKKILSLTKRMKPLN